MLSVACCMLHVACCMLHVACCRLHARRCCSALSARCISRWESSTSARANSRRPSPGLARRSASRRRRWATNSTWRAQSSAPCDRLARCRRRFCSGVAPSASLLGHCCHCGVGVPALVCRAQLCVRAGRELSSRERSRGRRRRHSQRHGRRHSRRRCGGQAEDQRVRAAAAGNQPPTLPTCSALIASVARWRRRR